MLNHNDVIVAIYNIIPFALACKEHIIAVIAYIAFGVAMAMDEILTVGTLSRLSGIGNADAIVTNGKGGIHTIGMADTFRLIRMTGVVDACIVRAADFTIATVGISGAFWFIDFFFAIARAKDNESQCC